jgi:hypothetical protein
LRQKQNEQIDLVYETIKKSFVKSLNSFTNEYAKLVSDDDNKTLDECKKDAI